MFVYFNPFDFYSLHSIATHVHFTCMKGPPNSTFRLYLPSNFHAVSPTQYTYSSQLHESTIDLRPKNETPLPFSQSTHIYTIHHICHSIRISFPSPGTSVMALLQPHTPVDLNQNKWFLMLNHICTSRPAQEETEEEEEEVNSQVIPGLPDDIAYECLLRAPLTSHQTMSRVSSQWRRLLQAPDFYSHRSQRRLSDTWICALARDNRYTNTVRAFDIKSKTWFSLPPMPDNRHRHAVGQEIAVVGGKIVICGGWRENPLDSVSIFDPVTYTWLTGPPMLSPRAHFVSGVIGDRLYVAGGGDGKQPRSAEAEFFDPVENKWFPVASLEMGISFCLGVAMSGKLFVQARGGVPRETMVFLPDFGMWSALRSNMLAWPHRPHAVVNDELLYRSDFKEGKHELMVYDGQIDAWKSVGMIENRPNRRISEIVGVGGEIWGVAEDFSVGLLQAEISSGSSSKLKFVSYVGGAESSERLICCRVLVR